MAVRSLLQGRGLSLALVLLLLAAAHGAKLGGGAKVAGVRGSVHDSSEEAVDEADDGVSPAGGGGGFDSDMAHWMMQQAGMYQTRLALLSVELDKKGYGVRGVIPQPPGLICAKSTKEHPLRCRVYMEPEEGSKVVAPCRCKGSQRWIAIRALNQQRRREPLKWSKCPTCQAHIDYNLYESHMAGLDRLPTAVLNNRSLGRAALAGVVAIAATAALLALQGLLVRLLVSGALWSHWDRVQSLRQGSLPLYILAFQWARKRATRAFLRVEEGVRGELTEMESSILERTLPETLSAAEAEAAMGSLMS